MHNRKITSNGLNSIFHKKSEKVMMDDEIHS